jgi:AcrR family transcriptional regulator
LAPRKPHRQSQEERSAATRTRLLEAAIECVAELGAAATTTPDVAARAGLSRGAQQYHFPTKAALMAEVARYVTQGFHEELRRAVVDLPSGSERITAAIDVMWAAYSGQRALAHTELWVAARTDADLRDAVYEVERSEVPETRRLLRELFSSHREHSDELDLFVDITAQFLRGLVLRSMLREDSRWIRRDVEAWKTLAAEAVPAIEDGSASFGEAWAALIRRQR